MSETHIQIAADDRPLTDARAPMARWGIVAIGVALIAIGVAAWYFWQRSPAPVTAPAPAATPAPAPSAPAASEPQVEHPVAAASGPSAPPLPALAESDAAATEALASLFGAHGFDALFRPQELVRNFVATIDNLPRKNVALRLMPLKPVPGPFQVTGSEAALSIGPENAARYTPYVKALAAVDSAKLVAVYVHFYPLFQQAYADLGYPTRYFNDRLFEVIDHLLATPDAPRSLPLVQPKVLYEYADPALADLSAGQKILLRMGPENEAQVKAKLREIKRALAKGN
jgi:hypothetical protein